MNNNPMLLFIGLLIEEDHNRNFMRIERRRHRDSLNPFEMPKDQFIRMFRLNKQSTLNLINNLEQYIVIGNNNSITFAEKVLITLNFVSVGSYQNAVGANTWLSASQTMVSQAISEVCTSITQHLLPNWVKFPTELVDVLTVKQGFYRKHGMRGIVGAVDGTHVEILAPPVTDVDHPPFVYINRKGKHSINVMLISDANCKILACNARFPGSVHDAAVWQVSSIRNHLLEEYENGDRSSHLIGDSGYPLEPWLFTPFLNPAGQQQEQFNTSLTSARNVIERTNGVLKGRFRCLSRHRTLIYHPIKAANIIYTCCVRHNIALDAGIILNEEDIEYEVDNNPVIRAAIVDHVHQLGAEARMLYIRNNL